MEKRNCLYCNKEFENKNDLEEHNYSYRHIKRKKTLRYYTIMSSLISLIRMIDRLMIESDTREIDQWELDYLSIKKRHHFSKKNQSKHIKALYEIHDDKQDKLIIKLLEQRNKLINNIIQ